ncbi:MAG: matrixin family metalloprotease [Candidatus Colwellbacteria bacterium]|nr:matrixin family metalloprotease [Candidatus Colwellbacteria bacterium]
MKLKAFIVAPVALFVFGFLYINSALAYVWDGYKWEPYTVGYYINSDWASTYGTSSIQTAANQWNNAGSAFTLQYEGLTNISEPSTTDGYNTITSDNWGEVGTLAITISYAPWLYEVLDVDTVFNTLYTFSDSPGVGEYDIQSVMAHEFGHWLVLEHVPLSDCTDPSIDPVMCPGTGDGETYYRTLKQDDIDGINHIYPKLSGVISTDTTLTKERSPYIISGTVTVNSGVTLTVDAGAIIKFKDTSSELIVNGTLDVNGTSGDKVYFTSYKDDVGGDTNSDSSATIPTVGDWQHIEFSIGSAGNFDYAVARYGGRWGDGVIYNNGGTIALAKSDVSYSYSEYGIYQTSGYISINDSHIHHSIYSIGFFQKGGSSDISGSEFDNNEEGIRIGLWNRSAAATTNISGNYIHNNFIGVEICGDAVSADVTDNIISISSPTPPFDLYYGQWGVYICGLNTVVNLVNNSVINNSISDLAYPVGVRLPATLIHSGNVYSGSGKQGFYYEGNVYPGFDVVWNPSTPTYVVDDIRVATGATFTINAGTVVKFHRPSSSITIRGTFNVNGTAANPVHFTSIKDDIVGGDTNNDNAVTIPVEGDWDKIEFQVSGLLDQPIVNLNHAVIRYGGSSTGAIVNDSEFGDINMSNSRVSYSNIGFHQVRVSGLSKITNSRFDNNSYGLYYTAGTLTTSSNSFVNNILYGVYNSTTTPINMANNWWGNISGPTHTTNPIGIGDSVSDNVIFTPWLTSDPNP